MRKKCEIQNKADRDEKEKGHEAIDICNRK